MSNWPNHPWCSTCPFLQTLKQYKKNMLAAEQEGREVVYRCNAGQFGNFVRSPPSSPRHGNTDPKWSHRRLWWWLMIDWSDWAEGDESMEGEHRRLAKAHTCTSVTQVGINLLAVGNLWSAEGTRVRPLIPVLQVKWTQFEPGHPRREYRCVVDTRWSSRSGSMHQILPLLNVAPEAAAENADAPARSGAAVKAAAGFRFHPFISLFSWPIRLCYRGHSRARLFHPFNLCEKVILTSLWDLNVIELSDAERTVFIQLKNALGGLYVINRNAK